MKPQTCEVGDLAGKHGKIESDPYEKHYVDMYASTNPDSEAFFGDLSFVLHYANSTRLTCANFERKVKPVPTPGDDCTDEPQTPGGTPVQTPPVYTTPPIIYTITPSVTESTLPGVTETHVVEVPCEKDCKSEGNAGHDKGDDNGDNAGDADTVVPPPPQEGDENAPPASTPSTVVPVVAGASMQGLSSGLLSIGVIASLFMIS